MRLERGCLRVAQEKIIDYLLNTLHPEGNTKARFFLHCGFQPERWEAFVDHLIEHGAQCAITKEEDTLFGMKYVVEGPLRTTLRDDPLVRTVWFLARGESIIKLVTAYPLKL